MYRKTENLDGREKKGETIIMDYFKKLYLNLIYVDNVSIFFIIAVHWPYCYFVITLLCFNISGGKRERYI